MKKLIGLFLVLVQSVAFGDWDPEEYAEIDFPQDISNLRSLKDLSYLKLKQKVLKKSGHKITQEKVDLLMDLILIARPNVCVEIGVGQGASLLPIGAALRYLKTGKLYAIDAWSNEITTRYLDASDPNKSHLLKADKEKEYKKCLKTIDEWSLEKYCKVLRKTSEKAVGKIGAIDFLHLDGDYSEVGSARDVELYLPKVKSGGYILLSNFSIVVNGNQPKLKSFVMLFEVSEMVCEIEHDNAILFRKL